MAALLSLTNRMSKRLLYRLCVAVVAARYVPLSKNLVQAVNHFVQIVSFGKHRSFWRNVAIPTTGTAVRIRHFTRRRRSFDSSANWAWSRSRSRIRPIGER